MFRKGCSFLAKLIIEGPCRLKGEVFIHGAKNSALPLLSACLLCGSPCVLHNCPRLSDVSVCLKILTHLGCKITRSGHTVTVDPTTVTACDIPDDLMRQMRSSIVFLGAILSRTGQAKLSLPGGCELGPRPIDLHLSALRQLGASITESHGNLTCTAPRGLVGGTVSLTFPSVGATENLMLAAVCAKGVTVIHNAAREPEICDLAKFLNRCGARISGAGEGTILINGVHSLHGCTHTVIADRIEATTYLAAAAVTGSSLTLRHVAPAHLTGVLPVFEEAGCTLRAQGNTLHITAPARLSPLRSVRTMPYPGFPTDAQAPVMAMTTLASGASIFVETIFSGRYKHVGELCRMGANITTEGSVAVVKGVSSLSGAVVHAAELRGAAALVVAGLAAQGSTTIHGLQYLNRGYERLEAMLQMLGAVVRKK